MVAIFFRFCDGNNLNAIFFADYQFFKSHNFGVMLSQNRMKIYETPGFFR